MKYGRSLSFCVRDIVNGEVEYNDVSVIVTNTCAKNRKEFEKIIEIYSGSYWRGFASVAKGVALDLWDQGKIQQPRLINNRIGQKLYAYDIWADSYQEAIDSLGEM